MTSNVHQPLEWKTLESKECFNAAPWVRVFKDKIQLPSQRVVDGFYRIELPHYAMICARNPQGDFLLVRQYKHSLGCVSLGLPAGGILPNEDPMQTAKRELLEETGYSSDEWTSMGSFMMDGHRGCCKANFFLALNVKKVGIPQEDDMEIVETVFMSLEQVMEEIRTGGIPVLAAVSLLSMASNPMYLKMKLKES